jgi:hypothetical protein
MQEQYVGVLTETDPLYDLLANQVWRSEFKLNGSRPTFDVYRLDNCSTVYLYRERGSTISVVGKFFGNKWMHGRQGGDHALLARLMHAEADNMRRLRALGLDGGRHRIVAPLAIAESINCVLVEEFAPGEDLFFFIRDAICGRGMEGLRARLADMAVFLGMLHARSATPHPLDGSDGIAYLRRVIEHLSHWQIADNLQVRRLDRLAETWEASAVLTTGSSMLIHGDATPTNVKFCSEGRLAAFDVERVRLGDQAVDLGCLAAELKHLCFLLSGDRWASEPYVREFYERYCAYLEIGADEVRGLMERCRFFMGSFELRIARNAGLDIEYRRRLIDEAETCLQI